MAVLSGIQVIDLTRARAGPTAVRQLADWGADVIAIEAPPGHTEGPIAGPRDGPDFQNLHRNKRSLTLNLKSEEGLSILRRLAEKADILVENFRPGVMARLGLSYDEAKVLNPRLIYASVSGFGQDGPYRDRPGFDQIAQGMGGLMSITGLPGQGPVRVGIPIADLCSGILCAQGILLALLDREKSGEGQWVTTSLLEAQIFMLDFQASRWLNQHEIPQQAGNDHPTMIPTGVFRTGDGHINIGASGQKMWERLCQSIGAEELLADPRFLTEAARSHNREPLNREIERSLATAGSTHWIERLNAAGVPCGPIYSIDQVFADAHVQQLGTVASMPSSHYHPLRLLAQPMHLSRTPASMRLRPPELGEHNQEILSSLGFESGEIEALHQRGVI